MPDPTKDPRKADAEYRESILRNVEQSLHGMLMRNLGFGVGATFIEPTRLPDPAKAGTPEQQEIDQRFDALSGLTPGLVNSAFSFDVSAFGETSQSPSGLAGDVGMFSLPPTEPFQPDTTLSVLSPGFPGSQAGPVVSLSDPPPLVLEQPKADISQHGFGREASDEEERQRFLAVAQRAASVSEQSQKPVAGGRVEQAPPIHRVDNARVHQESPVPPDTSGDSFYQPHSSSGVHLESYAASAADSIESSTMVLIHFLERLSQVARVLSDKLEQLQSDVEMEGEDESL